MIVESVAGSGKTTTNLYIAKTFPELDILLLTYNARLKFETQDKVKQLCHNFDMTKKQKDWCNNDYKLYI